MAKQQRLGERLAGEVGDGLREESFGPEVTLVPMPGHAPRKEDGSHWAARELCEHFVSAGLGRLWLPMLERTKLVAKSATSAIDVRPSAEVHYESFAARGDLGAGASITVVDDVITRGATMLAAIARLQEAMPQAVVRGFALIRTNSEEPAQAVKEPVRGTVRQAPWGTKREP